MGGDVAAGGGRSSGIKDEEAVDMRGEDEHMRGMSKQIGRRFT